MGKNKGEKNLDKRLWQVYETEGVQKFLAVCTSLLSLRDSDNWEKKKHANGEVCEVVLAVLTENYFRKKRVEGSVYQSVVLLDKDKGRSSDFRTELDFLAITPTVCLTGECKSFVGDIVVTDHCTLTRGDLVADVARQSLLHTKYLHKYLTTLSSIETPPLGMFCFLFSNGRMVDRRASEWQQRLPVLTAGTLYAYYDRTFSRFSERAYDYERAQAVFLRSQNSEALHRQHRSFVGY